VIIRNFLLHHSDGLSAAQLKMLTKILKFLLMSQQNQLTRYKTAPIFHIMVPLLDAISL